MSNQMSVCETPKLRVDGLCKHYGKTVALEPTDLSVRSGEFLTLLGPSGSGKTTLLQMVSGLVEPTGGRLLIDGRDETQTAVHQRDIGLVFQHYALFPHLTVKENIGFPLRMRGLARGEVARRTEGALNMVQLAHLADRFPRELSGGQQQRVALARCFVYQPSIILMDEPLGALDKKLREHMQFEIKRLHRETGTTIIYVTHDQEEALAMSDRICLMNHARVEQIGTPHEIYNHPRTVFAAEFIGISNIFRGTVEQTGDGAILVSPHGRFTVPEGREREGEMSLIVRPEAIEIGEGAPNRIRGEVAETVYAGSETRILVETQAGHTVLARVAPGDALPRIGEVVTLGWKPDAGVLVA